MNSNISPEKPAVGMKSPGIGGSGPWLFALFSVFLLATFFGARLLNDSDLGYHLKGGEWILQNHSFPSKDTYTFTVSDHDYVDLHWLYQVVLYFLYKVAGYPALTLGNIPLILSVFYLLYRRIGLSRVERGVGLTLLVLAVLGCELRFRVRPEVVTWALMGFTLFILDERARRGKNLLFLLPVLQLVWTNVEGLFVLGPLLTGMYLISGYFHDKNWDKELLKYGGLSLLACLLNPYFLKGALFPLALFQTLGGDVFKEGINEFHSPWATGGTMAFSPFWTYGAYKGFSLSLFALFIATFRKRKLHEFLVTGSFLYLSATAQRNIPLFLLAAVPIAAACWRELSWSWVVWTNQKIFTKPAFAWGLALFALLLCPRIATDSYYVSERRFDRFGFGLDELRQPVKAAEFLAQNGLNGKMLNHLNLGGWLDWKAPGKTFLDGRLEVMGPELFAQYQESLKPGGLEPLLLKHGFDIIVTTPSAAPQWLYSLHQRPDWRPVYLDETAAIFLRKGYAPQVPVLDEERVLIDKGIGNSSQEEAVHLLDAPKPSEWNFFWEDFVKPCFYPQGLNELGSYFWFTTRYDLAETVFWEALQRTGGRYPETYFNLGSVYYNAKDYLLAEKCLRKVLEMNPGSRNAQYLLSQIPL
ncbi:MAG TPA: tetratricopeptide repeat protein [bacterium]|nr:tetratricopeptide repeat protein [bacterium]